MRQAANSKPKTILPVVPCAGLRSTIKAYARNADIKSNKKHPIKAPSLQKNALLVGRAF